ncbi:hypothetical protein B0H21DRAFT_789871 [Amylocystis lapponica]|nr:hypothetical protein B0H21DRAFT_789871 [Amylocystis lapponica]
MSTYRPYRGTYRGRGTGRAPSSSGLLPADRDLMEGLASTPLQRFSKPSGVSGPNIEIKNLEYVGSYNWVESAQPTIIVPGSPRVWRDRTMPYTVSHDTGIQFIDQNGYRVPSSPLLPLIRAVEVVAEDNAESFDWGAVDIVTDRNGLRKLLRWINDNDGSLKEFRIDTQLAGERTVLLSRWEKRTREDNSMGYGFNFEHENSTPAPGCERGTGHHRIVKYDFDGLTVVVRFEVDACLPAPSSRTTTAKPSASSTNPDDLSDLLSGLKIAPSAPSTQIAPKSSLDQDSGKGAPDVKIIRAGTQVPQDSVIEMTTRSKMNAVQFNWTDAYPQLYLSQTSHHFLAVHERGRFDTITKRTLGDPELKRVDANGQPGFKKLRKLLQDIQELVVEHGQLGRLTLVCRDGALKVFERINKADCLPESVLERISS